MRALVHLATSSPQPVVPVDSAAQLDFGDIIQVVAVLAAVGASIVALVIANQDRKTQLELARRDLEHQRLLVELEYAVRLSANRNRGGSSDKAESARLGSEALALAGVVGERWVPNQWLRARDNKSTDELRAQMDGETTPDNPEWVKDKIETALAIESILAKLYAEK